VTDPLLILDLFVRGAAAGAMAMLTLAIAAAPSAARPGSPPP